jgi:hypothetical protein
LQFAKKEIMTTVLEILKNCCNIIRNSKTKQKVFSSIADALLTERGFNRNKNRFRNGSAGTGKDVVLSALQNYERQ